MKKLFFSLLLLCVASVAWAQYGEGSIQDIENFNKRAIDFVIFSIGGAAFVGGGAFAAIRLMMHKEDAFQRAGWVVGGGAFLVLIRIIWNVMQSFAR